MISELRVSKANWEGMVGHLFSAFDTEHTAFLFARTHTSNDRLVLSAVDYYLVPPSGFAHRSALHFELNREVQADIIKQAHDRDCCLVEAHSHPFPTIASFSPTDVSGILEWVPHVRWRLQRKPYVALVLSPASFDALLFSDQSALPQPLDELSVGETRLRPTGITARNWEVISNGSKPI